MGIFGTSSPFDDDIEKATSENNTSEQWGLIMEICDRVSGGGAAGARECVRAVLRRAAHADPHVALQAATLLDACVANCGRPFHLEVASRDFETEFRRVLARAQPPVAQRLRALLRKWAEGEFRSDPQLDLIPALYARIKSEGDGSEPRRASTAASAAGGGAGGRAGGVAGGGAGGSAAAAAAREQDELARAIALSLRESTATPASAAAAAPLYPSVDVSSVAASTPPPPPPTHTQIPKKVRALYDFEAAEDNELTFLAGEIVHVTDASDPNWWKGYNKRGEGLFPANFVTADLAEPVPHEQGRGGGIKSVQWEDGGGGGAGGAGGAEGEEGGGGVCIDEARMDAALALLHEASPEAAGAEEARLQALERGVHAMGPLIDAALERADRRHARLTQLSAELVDALNLYHELMRDPPPHPAHPQHPPPAHLAALYPPPQPHQLPPQQPR